MVKRGRIKGAVDVRPRSPRSDRGKKRKHYRGKPVKSKRAIRFDRRRGNKEYLKIWAWQIVPKSEDCLLRVPVRKRPYIHKYNYHFLHVQQPHVSEISTKKKFEQYMEENYWDGEFIVMGVSHGKTRTRYKWVKLCKFLIKETGNGNKAVMIHNYRLSRYKWFYKG